MADLDEVDLDLSDCGEVVTQVTKLLKDRPLILERQWKGSGYDTALGHTKVFAALVRISRNIKDGRSGKRMWISSKFSITHYSPRSDLCQLLPRRSLLSQVTLCSQIIKRMKQPNGPDYFPIVEQLVHRCAVGVTPILGTTGAYRNGRGWRDLSSWKREGLSCYCEPCIDCAFQYKQVVAKIFENLSICMACTLLPTPHLMFRSRCCQRIGSTLTASTKSLPRALSNCPRLMRALGNM